jgi:hypothetical protein
MQAERNATKSLPTDLFTMAEAYRVRTLYNHLYIALPKASTGKQMLTNLCKIFQARKHLFRATESKYTLAHEKFLDLRVYYSNIIVKYTKHIAALFLEPRFLNFGASCVFIWGLRF